MGEGQKITVGRIIGRTMGTTVRFLAVFLGLAIIAYAAARAAAVAGGKLFPLTGLDAGTSHLEYLTVALLKQVGLRLLQFPAAIVEALAVGMIVHRAVSHWRGASVSLRADATAAMRAFWALAGIALTWIVLGLLPYLPDWFRQPPTHTGWLLDAPWLPTGIRAFLYFYVLWHPFITLGLVLLLVLGILWCLAIPAAVLEGLRPFPAFKRSMALTRSQRLRILGLWLIFAVLGVAMMFVSAEAENLSAVQSWTWKPWAIGAALQWLLGTIVMAVGTAAIYAEARRIEETTNPAGATVPAPTAAP